MTTNLHAYILPYYFGFFMKFVDFVLDWISIIDTYYRRVGRYMDIGRAKPPNQVASYRYYALSFRSKAF
jgi:hypothetical protein